MRPCAACRGFGTIIPEPCRECSGDGRVRSRRTLTVKIPAGVDTGTRVQLSGEGEVGPGGGPAGDLYVEMHVADHPVFTRHGVDLLCQRHAADDGRRAGHHHRPAHARGRRRRPRTPTSRPTVPLEIQPGTQSGTETVLGGRGVPSLRGTGRGDLIVRIVVETPTRLDDRQEELLRELAALRDEESPDGRHARPAQVGLQPAPRRVRPAMSLPVFVHPALAGLVAGDRRRAGRRRGPARGRGEADPGRRAGRADRRRRHHGHRDRRPRPPSRR